MSRRIGGSWFFGLVVVGVLRLAGIASGEPPSREPLDALWEQYMLEGRSGSIDVRKSQTLVSENAGPALPFEMAQGSPESAFLKTYGISVMRLGEGFWLNGGWVLQGGLLSRATDGSSTFELYGKAVVRQFPYFPFPFHRSIPHETGYEFFLLHRKGGSPRAAILRKWVFPSNEVVIIERRPGGDTVEDVRGMLRYDAGTRTATVTITGLKRPFEERVDLSRELGTGSR